VVDAAATVAATVVVVAAGSHTINFSGAQK